MSSSPCLIISVSAILLAGTDSPVSAASSILSEADSKMRQSAGTESPASRITMSPGTNSLEGTEIWRPSRMTLEVAAVISCRASRASSALDSCTTPSTAFTMTTKRMMMTSAVWFSPEAMPTKALMTAAQSSMMIMGSAIWAKNRFQSGVFFPSASLFRPYFSSRAFASSLVKPFSKSVLTSSMTFSASDR